MEQKSVSQAALARLPTYLSYLKSLSKDTPTNISATAIAYALDMGEVQVRKDLASVCEGGKPKIGYSTSDLIDKLETFLGYRNVDDAVIVGVGKLGAALLSYNGFMPYGLNITAAFDIDDSIVNKLIAGKQVYSLNKFEDLCRRLKVKIGIITVPAKDAQGVCDMMVKSGICAIMNFAPTHLRVPNNVLLQNENIALSLALLSKELSRNNPNG